MAVTQLVSLIPSPSPCWSVLVQDIEYYVPSDGMPVPVYRSRKHCKALCSTNKVEKCFINENMWPEDQNRPVDHLSLPCNILKGQKQV